MKWFLVWLQVDCMFCDLLRDRQTFFLSMFMFSIFDKIKFIRTHCSKCIFFEIVFSLRDIRTNTRKILFWLSIVKSTNFSDSMYSKRFMMKNFCIEKCRNRIWSTYSFVFDNFIQNNFTKSTDSNQFLKIFFQKTFATVFAREFYSYEIDILNLNCLKFKITISWLEIWNEIAWNSTKTLFFKLISWFLLQLIMQDFLRQRLMIMSTKFVIKNSLLLLLIAWSLKFLLYNVNLIGNDQIAQLLFFFKSTFANQFLLKQYRIFAIISNAILFFIFAISVELDWMLVNFVEFEFLSSSWFWTVLYSCDFAFVRFFDRVFLLKSSCDFLTKIFCYIFIRH